MIKQFLKRLRYMLTGKDAIGIPIQDLDKLKDWKWPFQRINFGGEKEYSCPHDIGHGGLHGCDGCCAHPSFKRETKQND